MGLLLKLSIGTLGTLSLLALYTAAAVLWTEHSFPPIGEFVIVDNVRLHYLSAGEGPPVVLLHGANTSLRDFEASILGLLAAHHRVIAFDRPGYGYSERGREPWVDPSRQAELVRAALDRLGVERPVLVGHSWSGAVVLNYLLRHPHEVAGAVLLGGAAYPWEGGVSGVNHAVGWPIVGPVIAASVVFPAGQLLIGRATTEVFSPNPAPDDYARRTGALLALRPAAFRASAQDVRRLSSYLEGQSRRYRDIRVPLLLVTGDADAIVPSWNHADRLIHQVPNAELVKLADTGHAPHHVHPTRVAALIGEFTARVSSSPAPP